LKTSSLILDFEFDQHLESHKHVINIIMWFRDMGCYNSLIARIWHSIELIPFEPCMLGVGCL
jgi:hypothetical protein